MKRSSDESVDVSNADVVQRLFTPSNVLRTSKRMRARQEKENDVEVPVRKAILVHYGDELARGLALAVSSETWSPSPAYVVLIAKRSGTYREMVFPGLLDAIVGRRLIDALEPAITRDENGKQVFFGRSHANTEREPGDYEDWFKVWRDFTAEIGVAAKLEGFTYMFDTDATQFFPSIELARAKSALAQRTQAHQTLLELLFYCLEAWSARVRYCPVPGLPIEPNDVSRIVAHNYIEGVDEHFVHDKSVRYQRWVDDTIMFVSDEQAAHRVKLKHHLALREMGLSPNASKTTLVRAEEFQASRHPETNRQIERAVKTGNGALLSAIVAEWFARDPKTTNDWDRVAARLYTSCRQLKSPALHARAVPDICEHPILARQIIRYLSQYELDDNRLRLLLEECGGPLTSIETRIQIAKCFGDARLAVPSAQPTRRLVESAIGEILSADDRLGSGYEKALFLLVVNKHGTRSDRERARTALTFETLQDDQLGLHFLYVFHGRDELAADLSRALRHLDTTDIALVMRLSEDAADGSLQDQTVLARHLPLLSALLRAEKKRATSTRCWRRSRRPDLDLCRFEHSNVCRRARPPESRPGSSLSGKRSCGKRRFVHQCGGLQEILHRYVGLKRPDLAAEVYELFIEVCPVVLPVTLPDTDRAKGLIEGVSGISVRDAIHAAVMLNNEITEIATFDSGLI